jgi:hypothetical protein
VIAVGIEDEKQLLETERGFEPAERGLRVPIRFPR